MTGNVFKFLKNKIQKKKFGMSDCFFIIALILYPLRHISVGIDLMDQGYNLVNFKYFGLEHMSPMWFFSTYLSNAIGKLFTMLPRGNELLIMNLYTGLIVSIMAVLAYLFFTLKISMSKVLTFICEIIAISLCWLPTEVLYTYLTYFLVEIVAILIYLSTTGNKKRYLFIAGVLLGISVFVKFPNVIYVSLIIPVIYFYILKRKSFKEICKTVSVAVTGFVSGFAVIYLMTAIKYGPMAYINGIKGLFQMTETASDYKADSLIYSFVNEFRDISYFGKRFLLFILIGLVISFVLKKHNAIRYAVFIIASIILTVWLVKNDYFARNLVTYQTMYRPAMMMIAVGDLSLFLVLFSKKINDETKLLAMTALFISVLPAFGSNNAMLAVINFMFISLPMYMYAFAKLYKAKNFIATPAKYAMGIIIIIFAFRATLFGMNFIYEEATGAVNAKYEVNGIENLKGMKTTYEKKVELENLATLLSEREYITTFDNIPGLIYYFDLKPAMNSWGDLRSVSVESFKQELENISTESVIVIGKKYGAYIAKGTDAEFDDESTKIKADLLGEYILANELILINASESAWVFY